MSTQVVLENRRRRLIRKLTEHLWVRAGRPCGNPDRGEANRDHFAVMAAEVVDALDQLGYVVTRS